MWSFLHLFHESIIFWSNTIISYLNYGCNLFNHNNNQLRWSNGTCSIAPTSKLSTLPNVRNAWKSILNSANNIHSVSILANYNPINRKITVWTIAKKYSISMPPFSNQDTNNKKRGWTWRSQVCPPTGEGQESIGKGGFMTCSDCLSNNFLERIPLLKSI